MAFDNEQKQIQGKGGISLLDENGGCTGALYTSSQIQFITPLSKDGQSLLSYVKVGEKGDIHRAFTTCCNTQMNNCLFGNLVCFNLHCIKEKDGSAFAPATTPPNVCCKYAFEEAKDKIPQPRYSLAPISWLAKFALAVLNPFATSIKKQHPELNPTEAEVVPITWE